MAPALSLWYQNGNDQIVIFNISTVGLALIMRLQRLDTVDVWICCLVVYCLRECDVIVNKCSTDIKTEDELVSELKSSYQRAVEERQSSFTTVIQNLLTMVTAFLKRSKSSEVRSLYTFQSQFGHQRLLPLV